MGDPSTVILEIQGVPLTCNRADLIQHSDYFRAMLEGSFIESGLKTITLNEIEVKAMKIILKLLRDNEYIVDEENILSVLQASCMLQFLQIKDICSERVKEFICVDNCLKIWQCTELLDLKDICHKAKLMALLEFMSLRDTSYFVELELENVVNYLGSVYLQCLKEFTVFESIIAWLQNSKEQSEDVILKLLHCVDFNALTVEEICDITSNQTISKFDTICDILRCVVSIKNGENVCGSEVEQARSLLKSQGRNYGGQLCILVESMDTKDARKQSVFEGFFCYDVKTRSFDKLFEIEPKICENLDGFKVASYKNLVFLFGGEFLIEKGDSYLDFYVYDVIKEKWKRKMMAFPRHRFESCIAGKYLYVIAGIGPYERVEKSIFWHDIEEDIWSVQIKLPTEDHNIKCCAIENRLFVFHIRSKLGYIFNPENQKWTQLTVCDPNNTFPFYDHNHFFFYYKKILYVRTLHYSGSDDTFKAKLFQLKITDDSKIIIVKDDFLDDFFVTSHDLVESVLCGNILYITNQDDPLNRAKLVNLDTYEISPLVEKRFSENLEIAEDTSKTEFCSSLSSVFHPKFLQRNDLIN